MDIPWRRGDPNAAIDIEPGDQDTFEITGIPSGTTRVRVRVTAGDCPQRVPDSEADPGDVDLTPASGSDLVAELVTSHDLSAGQPADYVAYINSPALGELANPQSQYLLRVPTADGSMIVVPFSAMRGRLLGYRDDGRLELGLAVHPDAAIRQGDDYVVGFGFEPGSSMD